MKTHSFFDPVTGVISGRTVTCSPKLLELNTPKGMVAIEGRFNHETQRVDVETGQVVAHEPGKQEVLRRRRDEQARARIAALETAQLRPLRELAIDPASDEAKQRLAAIEAEIETLRGDLR